MSIFRLNCARLDQWYAIEVSSFEDDLENLEVFVEEGTVVAYCDDIESAAMDLNLRMDQITIIDPNDDDA